MPTGEEEVPKPLHVFKTELASVLENNAAKLFENRSDKTDLSSNSKTSQKKSSQTSLARLFSSRSPSTLTINSHKSESAHRSSEIEIQSETRDRSRTTAEEVQVKRKEYSPSKSLSSSDSEDSDIQYSKLPSNGKSRFFVALPAMTRNREKTPEQPEPVAAVATLPEARTNVENGGNEFVRNVRGLGAQLRKSFFKRKSQRSEEKLGPLKQIRSDDDSSESEPEVVTVFMPRPAETSHLEEVEKVSPLPGPEEQSQEQEQSSSSVLSETKAQKKKNPKLFSRKSEKKGSKSVAPSQNPAEAAEEADLGASKKAATRSESNGKVKSKSNFYASDDVNLGGTDPDASAPENGLRQYFEEALGTEEPLKTQKRRHLSWFSRKRKSEKPEVAVATKCFVDIGTQFPEESTPDRDSRTPSPTKQIADGSSAISEEMLWKVPREPLEDQQQQSDSGMLFRCPSSHNEFPIHESDYVPGDSELTLSSLDVTEKVNNVSAPTYYGSNPKPARIPIFSACCPAKAADLSVPYVKPSQKEHAGGNAQKLSKEQDARERNPAIAMVKTVAKQVVDKLRERERKKKKADPIFYPMTQGTMRRWNSCVDIGKTSVVDGNLGRSERRRSL